MKSLMIFCILVVSCVAMESAERIQVGAAKIDVTPEFPVVLAGFAGRKGEFTGKDTPLFARAIAIGHTNPVVIVAVDNCGGPSEFADRIARILKERHDISRERFVLCYTHTHNAPNLAGYAKGVWGPVATEKQWRDMERYSEFLEGKIVELCRQALEKRVPADLTWTQGRVFFGGNRRLLNNGKWAGFGFQEDGPVDHSLPLLVAKNSEGVPVAIWTSYACHCTTPGSVNRLHWDWAGAACQKIEMDHPGATALVTIGCGADVGPQPSGSAKIAEDHGKEIAVEIARLLSGKMETISNPPAASREEFGLPLGKLPAREQLEQLAQGNPYAAYNARYQLGLLDKNGKLESSVPYSITSWKFGGDLAMIFLNGEVCVDYAVRLKTEMDWRRIWINAWANSVPCYIPSMRVLNEGGYEPDDSMIYYLKPTRFANEVEEVLVAKAKQAFGETFRRKEGIPQPDFLKLPPREIRVGRYLRTRFSAPVNEKEKEAIEEVRKLSGRSVEGYERLISNDGEEGTWFDAMGANSSRPFIRQLEHGMSLSWSPSNPRNDNSTITYVFVAGMGYLSEPKTEGFALLVDGVEKLRFDIALSAARWSSQDGRASLFFLPTWSSSQDAAGLFYLILKNPGKTPILSVRSLGKNSRRWFALERISGKEMEKELLNAVGGVLK